MSEKSNIFLAVARTTKARGYHDLSVEYYEAYAKEKEHENVQVFTLEEINIAGQANLRFEEKIPCIKEVRERTNFGLKEAKDLVEAVRGEYREDTKV